MLQTECLHPQPNSSVLVFGSGAFGRWLGHGGGAFMNGINALIIKETPDSSLVPSAWQGLNEKTPVFHLEEGSHQSLAASPPWSYISSLQNSEKHFCCFEALLTPVWGTWLSQSKWTKMWHH